MTSSTQSNCLYGNVEDINESVLADYDVPPWLISGSLLDDEWVIQTEDPNGRRFTQIPIKFSVPIAPGNIRLTDPSHQHDLLTCKLYILHGLDANHGWTTSAITMRASFRALLDLIRWREHVGLHRMSELGRSWYSLFHETLRYGRSALLPYSDRMREYIAAVRSGTLTLPVEGKIPRVLTNSVAAELGLISFLQCPTETIQLFDEFLKTDYPECNRQRERKRVPKDLALSGQTEGRGRLPSAPEEIDHIGDSRATILLQPWDILWRLRHHMEHDPISFRAFSPTERVSAVARALTRKRANRTPVPPAHQTCFLIDASLKLIADNFETVSTLLQLIREAYVDHPCSDRNSYLPRDEYLDEGVNCLLGGLDGDRLRNLQFHKRYSWRQEWRGQQRDLPDLRQLLFSILPAACAVVVAAFTARRSVEIQSLKEGCISRNAEGDPSLTCWIEKSSRQFEIIPVPESVIKAIELLSVLSRGAREKNNSKWLFEFMELDGSDGNVNFDLNISIRALASYVNVPTLPDGTHWQFRSHQFRTFFATVYFYRFHYPSLTALSYFLFHFDPDQTKRYCTDVLRGQRQRILEQQAASIQERKELSLLRNSQQGRANALASVQHQFLIETVMASVDGVSPMGGFGGETWNAEINHLIERTERSIVFSSGGSDREEFGDLLTRWLEGKALTPHPVGHSYCKCSSDPSDLNTAACLRAHREAAAAGSVSKPTGPNHAYAADLTCSGCPHNVQLPQNRKHWEIEQGLARNAGENGFSERQRCLAIDRANQISAHIDRCFPRCPPPKGKKGDGGDQ